MSVNDIR